MSEILSPVEISERSNRTPSSVASYHGAAMSVAMIRCRRSHYRAPWTEGVAEVHRVNLGRTTSRMSMSSLLRFAEDRRQWAATTAEAPIVVPQRRVGFTDFDWLSNTLTTLSGSRPTSSTPEVHPRHQREARLKLLVTHHTRAIQSS